LNPAPYDRAFLLYASGDRAKKDVRELDAPAVERLVRFGPPAGPCGWAVDFGRSAEEAYQRWLSRDGSDDDAREHHRQISHIEPQVCSALWTALRWGGPQ